MRKRISFQQFLCFFYFLFNTILFFSISPSIAVESVTLQLKWKHQFQFAGYYAALEKGFYRKAGLDVRILEIKDGEESTDKVIEGKADFGIAMSDLILRRAKGQPVVALAAIFQHSPLIILAPKSSGIENIHALKGKRIGMEAHSAELIAYIGNEGISLKKFELVPHDYSVSNLISGKVDAISAYSTDEPFMLLDQGIEYSTFTPRAGGIDFYGDTLFTSETQIREHPERVAAFLTASLKGWQYALENSEEIIDLILSKYTQRHSREHLLFEAHHSKSLIMADVVQLGYMNIGRWNHIAQTYAKLGMIDKKISLDGFLYTPDSITDYGWLKRIIGILVAICSLLGLGALILVFFNRRLSVEVNERKRAEETLRESEEKYRSLIENIADVIFILDKKGVVKFISPNIEIILGYNSEDIVHHHYSDYVHPEDLETANKGFKEQIQGSKNSQEFRMKNKEGCYIWISALGSIKKETSSLFQGILRDITERKQAEIDLQTSELKYRNQANFLDMVLENSPFAMQVMDTKGVIIRANQALRDILNVTDDMIVGKYNVLHDENIEDQKLMPVVEAVFNDLKSARFIMFWTGAKAGDVDLSIANEHWIDVAMFPITDEVGKLVNVVCQYVDITERKQAEEHRDKLIAELEKALSEVKKLSGLLPICSHCKKIRDDKGYWNQIEGYIQKHSDAEFSHGMCPECSDELYEKEDWYIEMKNEENQNK